MFNKKKKIELAKVIENWNPSWDIGAPMPQVYSNGHKTFLIYYIEESENHFDGQEVTIIDNTSETIYPIAVVEFINSHTHKFGTVNDEAIEGHPLSEKGLESYSAHIIENSTWLEEIKNVNKFHEYYDEKDWENKKHYFLFFHDEMFEIIAEDYKIEVFNSTFLNIAIEIGKRLNK